ncbi:MAG TPA: cyclic 2,3-diphosphoglycerate synthase [Terriglobales bacterium]|jgi:predicted GTPase|nr:cyclic 2,3-diphosphoglycerate synthase [Terriglobales bacterium]
MQKVLILGAAGRDFHNFNVVFRRNPDFQVAAFTATQIPDIANRRYPPELAGPLYPQGIPIADEKEMERLIAEQEIDIVVFSYSDVAYPTVMHLASRAVAAGSDFWLLGTEHTQVKSSLPVVSVCAVRTGCGKSPVSRRVAAELRRRGWNPVVIRHPMPYGDLAQQAVQRFARLEDLERHKCTIEEREEYEPHIVNGTVVYAGVDYEAILRQAESEGDLILWDGGNNDTPFYASDLEIVVADPHRPGHELGYYPGEVNLRRADVVVINKVDTAAAHNVDVVRQNVRLNNPKATIIEAACKVSVAAPEQIKGRRVLVVEDGPTLTHGEMPYGAGVVAARQWGAAELMDARPYAVGSIRGTYDRFTHLTTLLPAMGYSAIQRHELEETINRVPADLVLVATPVDLGAILRLNKPCVRVGYEVEERTQPTIADVLAQFTARHEHRLEAARSVV